MTGSHCAMGCEEEFNSDQPAGLADDLACVRQESSEGTDCYSGERRRADCRTSSMVFCSKSPRFCT